MSILEDLINIINIAEDIESSPITEESLDEKIVSKRAQRRKKRKLAQQKAQQAKEQKEKEAVDGEDENNSEEDNKPGTQLVVYQTADGTEDEPDDFSPHFKELVQELQNCILKYQQAWEKCGQEWKSAGEDKPCPPAVWDSMNTCLSTLQQECQTIVDKYITNDNEFHAKELQQLDIFFTALNGYVEKQQQQVMAIKPNLVEDDFNAPAVATGTEVTTVTSTALTTTTGTDVAVLEEPTDKQSKGRDKRKEKDLVSYSVFWPGVLKLDKALQSVIDGLGNVLKMAWDGFKNLTADVATWFNDALWATLNSPLARDIVKTFMYSNPITKMIFDGDFGNFGFGGALDKLRNAAKDKINKIRPEDNGKPFEKDKDKYTQRGFPKDLKGLTLKRLYKEFYGNLAIVDLINVSYNHKEVKPKDKAQLQKLTTTISRAFKTKNVGLIRSTFQSIIDLGNEICDYMDWTKPSHWMVNLTRLKRGNTKEEQDKIDRLRKKKKSTKKETSPIQKKYTELKNADWEGPDIRNELLKEFTKDEVSQFYNNMNKPNESLEQTVRKMQQLLEQAQG